MEHHEPAPRHRRRRSNRAVRAALDEARAAGLVQRHLLKLHHLAAQSRRCPAGPPDADEREAA
ncbi:hypothetical protein VA596_45765 [Amycolatopsis sp., V23-08]|uniref:Uncharacterized protein n=1 Tax=Amycolatopsis heterodermiae TaxID=3110235 RepID=A0ABU5RP43_9PSEU|nr:hypothetical protein [Amycolatopsis sp., V23-08]MEA5366906.1 hypothetical protein [Amycolatopsis sp., V23-08]